jgi:O-antigen/teichoic acid export membrane protein
VGVTQADRRAGTFSSGVLVLFATQVAGAAIGIVNGIVLARLLGPALKGDYYILVLLPATAMVLVQLGLPQALAFFAARGGVSGMVRQSLALTVVLSVIALTAIAFLLPHLENVYFETAGLGATVMVFLALPLALNATFTSAIVMGRQAVRWFAIVNITYPLVTTVLLIVILGGIGPSVAGAIVVFLVASIVQSTGFTLGARRVSATVEQPSHTPYRELFRYGLRFYPSSVMGFFSARIDVFLIAGLISDAAVPLGLYSMAVGLAELIFFFPSAVSSLFFPHVAASSREDADSRVAEVSRVTLLVTGTFALLLVPAAALIIWVLLPAFEASLAPLLVLLPGVVALSIAKVLGGYVTGIGRPGVNSALSIAALAANVSLNLVLIPRLGIIGAALASLVSYTFNAVALTLYSSRAAGTSVASFWVIRPQDVRFTLVTSLGLIGRVRSMLWPVGSSKP